MATHLTEHFTLEECTCNCGCGYCGYPAYVVVLAEKVRSVLASAMHVHCVARCIKRNTAAGGSPNSAHLRGEAMDFHAKLPPKECFDIILEAYRKGKLPELGGVGLYDWGLHIDVVKAPDGHLRIWDYRKKK